MCGYSRLLDKLDMDIDHMITYPITHMVLQYLQDFLDTLYVGRNVHVAYFMIQLDSIIRG